MGDVAKVVNRSKSTNVLKVGRVEYKLPETLSKPVDNLGGYVMLVYGAKKIGKTTLCSVFEDSLFLFFEPGGKALRIYQEPMTSWKKFTRFIDLIIKDKRFKTIIIDPADYAYDECMEEVCNLLGITHPTEAGYGKGWNAVKKEFINQILRLTRAGKGVIFLSHQKEEEIEDRHGKTFMKKTNTMSRQAKEVLEGIVDIWANYDYEGKKRVLTILGDDYIDAGHRLKERFRYTDGTRIRKINMGNSEVEAHEAFISAFNNKLEKPMSEEGGTKISKVEVKKTLNKFKK